MITEPSIPNGFESRHIGPSPQDVSAMLRTIGVSSLDGLIAQTVPDDIRQRSPLDLGPALSEMEALGKARQLAARNIVLTSLIGQGYYVTILTPVIQRNILENPAWYTAYTPYQPEISQGSSRRYRNDCLRTSAEGSGCRTKLVIPAPGPAVGANDMDGISFGAKQCAAVRIVRELI